MVFGLSCDESHEPWVSRRGNSEDSPRQIKLYESDKMVTKYGNLSESDLSSYKTFFTLFDLYFILFLLERKKLNE